MNDLAPEQIHQILADHRHTSKNQLVTDIKSYVSQQNVVLLRELRYKFKTTSSFALDSTGKHLECLHEVDSILEAKAKEIEEAYGR